MVPPLHLPDAALAVPPSAGGITLQLDLSAFSGSGMTLNAPQAPGTQQGGSTTTGQAQSGRGTVKPSEALLAAQRARQSARQSAAGTAAGQTVGPQPAGPAPTPPQQTVGPPPTGPAPTPPLPTGNNQQGGTNQTGNNQQGGTNQAGNNQQGGTNQTGNNQQGGTPQTPATVNLNDGQKTMLSGIKRTLVGRKCEEIGRSITGAQVGGPWKLADEARNNPSYTPPQGQTAPQGQNAQGQAQRQRKRDRVANFFGFGKKGEAVMEWGKDSVVDVGVPALDIASNAVDYTGGGSERSWLHVANKGEASAWGDGEIQSEGIPIAGAVVKSIDCLVQAVKLGFKLKDYYTEHKAGGHTGSERGELFMDVVDKIQNLLDTTMTWIGAFTTFLGKLPIIGAIIGAVNAGIGLVEDAVRLGKAQHYIDKMREQKTEAKQTIKEKQSAIGGGFGADKEKRYGPLHRLKKTRFKVNREFESVAGARPDRNRNVRLDEKTKQLRSQLGTSAASSASGGATSANPASGGTASAGTASAGATVQEKETAIRALEDYDVTKELTLANEHRRREGITKIILKDIIGFGTALAALDPSGLGATIGAAVNTAIGAGFLIQKAASKIRQDWRESGKFGSDQNKSDANKLIRRHNLAVVMYDRISELAETKVASIDNQASVPAETAAKLTEGTQKTFQLMDERIRAMGVAGPFLRSKNAPEMVKAMRKGFYRDT